MVVVPVSGSGASIVVSPVEGDGCIFTTLINSWLIGIFRIVGVGRSEHCADQAPFAGKVTLDFESFSFWNHTVEYKELSDLTLIRSITTKIKLLGFRLSWLLIDLLVVTLISSSRRLQCANHSRLPDIGASLYRDCRSRGNLETPAH